MWTRESVRWQSCFSYHAHLQRHPPVKAVFRNACNTGLSYGPSKTRSHKYYICAHSNLRSAKIWCSSASQGSKDETSDDDPVRTTLKVLGWRELSSHVSRFASTSLGKDRLQHIEIPSTYDETRLLQSETTATYTFLFEQFGNINLGRVASDLVHKALIRVGKGGSIDGSELFSVLRMLVVAQDTKSSLMTCVRESTSETIEATLKPLLSVWKSLSIPSHLAKRLSSALDDSGELQDTARKDLSDVRSRYRSLKSRLETRLRGMSGEVTMRAGRVCLMLPLDSSSPSGGLVIATSPREGAIYVEPQAVVDLNNQLAAAWGEMKTVEESVLWELTGECASETCALKMILEAVTHLDIATARAQYTRWISGSFPEFQDVPKHEFSTSSRTGHQPDQDSPELLVRLLGLRHPLLLGKHLQQTETLARQKRLKQFGAERAAEAVAKNLPVPLDLCIGMETRAIMITGPNTGGKTATLKSFGLAVLMARCGLGIPADADALLPRYSAVLADIGDEQNLASSLSTFSGHLKRIQALRDVADGDCLVLLDELGTGSNPEEGASLGAALVKRLVLRGIGGAMTTVATTHHRLLSNLAYDKNLPSIMNASVEFDEELMAPTYRLMMGVPGRSNALAIASRLGMDPLVLNEASKRVGAEKMTLDMIAADLQKAQDQRSLQESEARELSKVLKQTRRKCSMLRSSHSALQKSLIKKQRTAYSQVLSNGRRRLSRLESQKMQGPSKTDTQPQERRSKRRRTKKRKSQTTGNELLAHEQSNTVWPPRVGDVVFVSKLKCNATIVKMSSGNKIQVRAGLLEMFVTIADISQAK